MPFKQAFDQKFINDPTEIKSDITISTTLEDVDQAVSNWFNSDQPIKIDNKNIPVVFATAERWRYFQQELNNELIRDPRTGLAILPIISLKRSGEQDMPERNVPADKDGATNIFITKEISMLKNGVITPFSLTGNLDNPDAVVYEVLSVQPPTWVKVTYSGIIWTQYMQDMNLASQHIIQRLKRQHSVFSPKGFSMFAMLDSLDIQNNEDDYGAEERIFKTGFSVIVEAPLFENVRATKINRTISRIRVVTEVILNKEQLKNFTWKSPYELDK